MSQESKTHIGNDKPYVVLIYNAQAGKVKGLVLEQITAFFQKRGLAYMVTDLSYCDWGVVREKLNEYADVRFIAAGGDGTLRLVFENLWKQSLLSTCSVAFIPLGSANIAAFSFRLPFGLKHALKRAVEGTPRPIDLGVIDDTYVFFIATIFGLASNVTVGAHRALKRKLGGLAYLFSIDRLFNSNYQGESFTISYEENGEHKEIESHSLIVCNQFNLGGLKPLRGIRPDDGLLHLITLHNTSPWGFVVALWEFFRGRRDTLILRHTKFTEMLITLKGFQGTVHLDGDAYMNLGSSLTFRVLPYAAKLVR